MQTSPLTVAVSPGYALFATADWTIFKPLADSNNFEVFFEQSN